MNNLSWLTSIKPKDTFDDLIAALPNAGLATSLDGDQLLVDENALDTRFGTRSKPSDELLHVEFDDSGCVVFAELSKPFATIRTAKTQAVKIGETLVAQQFALDGLERSKPIFRTTFHDARLCQFQTWIVGEFQSVDVLVWSYAKDAAHSRAFVSVVTHIRTEGTGQEPRPGSASYPTRDDTWAEWEAVGPGEGVHTRNRAYSVGHFPPTDEELVGMERPDDLDDVTIEEILFSIRQVISDDDKPGNAGA